MPIIILQVVLIALIGYVWGSIPAGYWMGKMLRGKDFDIRDYGSHKIGATNVLRTLGKGPAAIVFVFDLTKGILPDIVRIARSLLLYQWVGTSHCRTLCAPGPLLPRVHQVQRWSWRLDRGRCGYYALTLDLRHRRDYRDQYHCDFALRFVGFSVEWGSCDHLWTRLLLCGFSGSTLFCARQSAHNALSGDWSRAGDFIPPR